MSVAATRRKARRLTRSQLREIVNALRDALRVLHLPEVQGSCAIDDFDQAVNVHCKVGYAKGTINSVLKDLENAL